MKLPFTSLLLVLSISGLFGLTNEKISNTADSADMVVIYEIDPTDRKKGKKILFTSQKPREVAELLTLKKTEPKVTIEDRNNDDGSVTHIRSFKAISKRCMCIANTYIEFIREEHSILNIGVHHCESLRETEGFKDNHDLTKKSAKNLRVFLGSLKQVEQNKSMEEQPIQPQRD